MVAFYVNLDKEIAFIHIYYQIKKGLRHILLTVIFGKPITYMSQQQTDIIGGGTSVPCVSSL